MSGFHRTLPRTCRSCGAPATVAGPGFAACDAHLAPAPAERPAHLDVMALGLHHVALGLAGRVAAVETDLERLLGVESGPAPSPFVAVDSTPARYRGPVR